MKKIYFLLTFLVSICFTSVKAQIVAWDFNTLAGNEATVAATTLNADLAATSVSRGAENYVAPGGTGLTLTAPTDGDYRSIATGNWSDILIWQTRVANLWLPAVTPPISTSNVYIQIGHLVTVDVASAICNDLHINNDATAVLAIGVNTLEVNGKIRSYVAAAAETTLGVDGIFYSGQASTNLVNNTNITSTASAGKMRFIGSSRTITFIGEWGNNPPGWDVEFAPTAGQTLTIETGFKARNITAVSGTTISSNTDMRPDGGAGAGTLTVKNGATLQFSNNSITIQRVTAASGTSHFGSLTVEAGGVLEFSGTSNPIIGATSIAFNGTVVYSGGGIQTFASKGGNSGAADPVTYTNVTISNTGIKTTDNALTTTINGTFSLQGTATSALGGGATLAYGAFGILEYKGSAVQTTGATPAEWPTVNGPFGLTINNTNGVIFSATAGRRINGPLSLTNGILTTSAASILSMGTTSTIPTLPTNASFVSGPVTKIGDGDFTFPIGKTGTGYVPIGVSFFSGTLDPVNDAFTAEYIRLSAYSVSASITDPLINHVSSCDYWTLDRTSGTQVANVTATWNSNNQCNGTPYVDDLTKLAIVHYNGTSWNSSSVGVAGTTGGPPAGTITWPNVATYSPFSLGSTSYGANPLPITINYFTGLKQNGNHLLNWKVTCTTTPSVTMELQRSIDARSYTGINTINATAVQCQQPFNYTDNHPAAGVNYYRLKMIDANGKITYSSIVSLINADKGFDVMNIAPNPIVGGRFNLNVSAAQKANMDIVITDMQGRVMQKNSVSMIAGFNTIPVNVSNFAKGTYQVYGFTAEGRSKVLRFVIQ